MEVIFAICFGALTVFNALLMSELRASHRREEEVDARLSKTLNLAREISAMYSDLLAIKQCTVCGAHVRPSIIASTPKIDVALSLIDELEDTPID